MNEQEIFERLCSHIMVLDKESPMDAPFFKRCYDICIKNKDEMTWQSIWEIVNKEATILKIREHEFKKMLGDKF